MNEPDYEKFWKEAMEYIEILKKYIAENIRVVEGL